MNIIARLTWRHMKNSKRRTLVTIAGTAISVAMITAVLVIVATSMNLFQSVMKAETGNWHIAYNNVAAANIGQVAQAEETEALAVGQHQGWAALPESADRSRQAMQIVGYTEESFLNLPLQMVEGVYPRSEDELLVSQSFIDRAALDWQIGDQVMVPWGSYTLQNKATGEVTSLQKGIQAQEMERAVWHGTSQRTFTVTGIARLSGELEAGWSGNFFAISGLVPTDDEMVNIFQAVKHVSGDIYEQGEAMGQLIGAETTAFNSGLLVYYGVVADHGFRLTMQLIVGILAIVIMVGSVSLIYNAFAISLTERSRMLGMLSSVGATKRQKKSSVFIEAALVGAIAIPLGVIAGYVGMWITFACFKTFLKDILQTEQSVTVLMPMWAILGAVFFAVVVLFVSAWIPARRAAAITPIEAIRSNQAIKISGKQVKTWPLTSKLFGFEAELALKNIKRSRSRYLATLFSLVISVVLFLTGVTFTDYMVTAYSMTEEDTGYDVVFALKNLTDQAEREAIMVALREQPYSDEVTLVARNSGYIPHVVLPEGGTDAQAEAMGNLVYDTTEAGEAALSVIMEFMDEESLRRFGDEAGIDVTPLLSNELRGIVLEPLTIKQGYNFTEVRQLAPQVEMLSWNDEMLGEVQLEIVGRTDVLPIYMEGYKSHGETLYVISSMQAGDAYYEAKNGTGAMNQISAYYNSRQSAMLCQDLQKIEKQYPGKSVSLQDITANIRLGQQLNTMISVFVNGFVILIILVCAANIFNTISTGVMLRGREFAMLRSVGMTPGKLNKLMCYESLFYGVKAILYGFPISIIIAYAMYGAIGRNFGFAFTLSWVAYLGAVLGVLILVGTTMAYAIGQVKKVNLIDGLRSENL